MKQAFCFLALLVTLARADVIYVVNALDESLGWYDSSVSQSDPNAVTLGNLPNDVLLLENRLYVVNTGYRTLQEIDPENWLTLREIELVGCVNPYSAAAVGSHFVAVTGTVSNNMVIVDLLQGSVVDSVYTGVAPQAVACYFDVIYVLNTGVDYPVFGLGTLKRFDAATLAPLDSLVVGVNPQAMSFRNDKLFISCTGNYDDVAGSVYVVDCFESLEIDTILEIGGAPSAISVGDSMAWIAAGGWNGDGHVYNFDPITYEILHGSGNPIITHGGATDVLVDPVGSRRCWVSCFSTGTLILMDDAGNMQLTAQMSAGPVAIAARWTEVDAETLPEIIPTSTRLQSAYPNPFNGMATLVFNGALRQPGIVDLYDALGRMVESLPVGRGETQLHWVPGSHASGAVATGSYFAHLRGMGQHSPIKVVYIK